MLNTHFRDLSNTENHRLMWRIQKWNITTEKLQGAAPPAPLLLLLFLLLEKDLKISGYVLSRILHGKQIKNRSKNETAGVGWRSQQREREKTRQRSVLSLIGRCDKIKVECSPYASNSLRLCTYAAPDCKCVISLPCIYCSRFSDSISPLQHYRDYQGCQCHISFH